MCFRKYAYNCLFKLKSRCKIADPEFCCGLTSPNDSLAQNTVGLSSLRPRSHNRGALCSMFMKRENLSLSKL